jgi:PAS domain S-box-containing protein
VEESLSEPDLFVATSLLLRALPEASLTVFNEQLVILMIARATPAERAPTASELVGRPVAEALAPARWEVYEPLLRAAIDGRSSSVEIDAVDRIGRDRVEVEPLRDHTGKVVGGVCLTRDIRDREQLLEALEQQRRLLDLAHDAVIVREPTLSAVRYWNREAREIYGYSADEARGQITHDLLATTFPVSREAVDAALRDRGRWDGELSHVRKDGERIIVASRQAMVRDDRGEPVAVIEINSDITERTRAERALREAEQQFRGLIESAPDAIVIVDEAGVIALVNVRAEELFEYPREELIGQPIEILLPRGLRGRHVEHRREFIGEPRARPMGAGMDLLARRKGGGEFLAEISLSPMQTESGMLISSSIRDISKQLLRQLEQALVPRMRVDERWHLAWRYRPSVSTMLLGGDFIGVAERADGSLSLLIGDVTGHGPTAAGTGAMLRAAWLGAVQGDVALEAIPRMLHRLLVNQADRDASALATVCLAEVDHDGRELRLIRAGHDSPLLITPGAVAALNRVHGPALGLTMRGDWPVRRIQLPPDAAIMLFTDGLTERRTATRPERLGVDELLPRIDAHAFLTRPPEQAIDEMLADVFPEGTEELDDDLAVILLLLRATDVAEVAARARAAFNA